MIRTMRAHERRLADGMLHLTQDRDRAAERYRDLEHEIEEYKSVIQDKTRRFDVSPDGLRSAMRSLEEQRQALVIKQAGQKASRNAIQTIISDESAKAAAAAQNDPVTQELSQIVDVRKKQLEQITALVKMGTAPAPSLLDAQSALAEAQIKLAEHGKDSAAGSIAGLNEKLEEMTVEDAAKQATLQAIDDQLERLSAVSNQVDQLEQLQNRLNDAEADLRQAEIDARLVDRELAISPPHSDSTPPTTQQNNQH